ncbi:NAD(P)H-dependent glycerol-3-phosphate dehydrogenase [Aridibaculum aurantiacum]|uniref:NAD(P)H-dependent glycerol-3-phosphate dehydrogenase n=1 Tax=Aridibaculum aurantiacum TaxID=2810307 RepID=UPI001A957B0F|nr:NAD(P)H-dependent glycerol-3-phosphate dehydrogenase [Aridibaculum aurantiacum]
MQFGIIGSGSWATALAKILTDGDQAIHWWVRNENTIRQMKQRRHNPHYLHAAYFNTSLLHLDHKIEEVVANADVLVVAIPSAYVEEAFENLPKDIFKGKKIVSAIKGILPGCNKLLNHYLEERFEFPLDDYYTVLGPCHAEEVASEKLSYLTFSGTNEDAAKEIADHFHTEYLNVVVNHDVLGAQYAAVLKNIYALGAGIAHGLEYGDNFQSVYIANAADEMVQFLKLVVAEHNIEPVNYAASVYLGDLLVTCYSLFSRNRTFGNMLGKGYSVRAAKLELNMVAEGYNASKCIFKINQEYGATMPIAENIYRILWEHMEPCDAFKEIENVLK